MIKVGIAGGAGFTGGELIRLLLNHPSVELTSVYSTSNAGNLLSQVHTDLQGVTQLRFSRELDASIDVLFLCLGHGNSRKYLEKAEILGSTKVIDLSHDFRLTKDANLRGSEFVYGLPEANKESIKVAKNIANPGCFATAIQLALLPLAASKLLKHDVHINAITGSTGAGQALSPTTNFTWRNNNVSIYKAFTHQHLGEIGETLNQLQPGFEQNLNFIPVRGNFTRGIFCSAYTDVDLRIDEVNQLYSDFYQDQYFVSVADIPIDLKQVVNTNRALIHLEKHNNKLLITCAIDNLLKGASGQAVQNMNLTFGLEEDLGLQLKASFF